MITTETIKSIVENDNIDINAASKLIGENNAFKISAILQILKVDIQSVADTKALLEICKGLVEAESTAFLQNQIKKGNS